jgi:hypothetical protein
MTTVMTALTTKSLAAATTIAVAAAVLSSATAAGQTIESAYTTFDAKKCKHKRGKQVEDYGAWECPGYRGLRVLLSAGDQRMYVTFGSWKKDDIALSQTFPGFNSAYEGTVEWRLEKQPNGKARPFATILRWNVRAEGDVMRSTGRALVVTRLGPGGVCHVGYVDARANPDANELARRIADEHARTFRCGKDKRILLGNRSPGFQPPADDE